MLKEKEELEKDKGKLKNKKSKKALKKELKKEIKGKGTKPKKSKKKSYKTKFSFNKKSIFSSVFILIMFTILISTGYLIFTKVFRAELIAKYLPADKTILTLELNTNFEHNQLIKTFQLLEKNPNFSKEKFITNIEDKFSVDYDKDLTNWLGRKMGIALINNSDETSSISSIYFTELISENNFNNFIQNQKPIIEEFNDSVIYKFEGSNYLSVIDDYLFISEDQGTINTILEFNESGDKSVYDTAKYKKIINNLPLTYLASFYLDFDQVNDALFQNIPLLSERGISTELLAPILDILDAEGIILVALDNNFATQSFITLDQQLVNNLDYLSIEEKYDAKLSEFIGKDAIVFWGGEDLESKLKRFLEILAGGNRSKLIVFDGLIENFTKKYFGENLTFESDIISLFNNEYALGIEEINKELIYKFIIELGSPQSDALRLQEIANSFATVGAIFEPKIIETELEDGTISRELIAIPEEINKDQQEYEDNIIYELKIGDRGWSIFYTTIDNIAIVTNSKDSMISTIDLKDNNSGSLYSNTEFITQITPVLKNSDEISYFNFDKVIPLIFEDAQIPEYIEIISTLVSGKNYFNDGIVTINYLHIN